MAPAEGDACSMEAFAPRRRVDHRLSLRVYFRTADNILKQVNVYRRESNTLELYVLLLRYASLVSETIPEHRQYQGMNSLDKMHLKRKLMEALQELEVLKPDVQAQLRVRKQRAARQAIPTLQERPQPVLNFEAADTNVHKSSLFGRNLSWKLYTPSAETIARHSFLGSAPQASRTSEPFKIQYPSLLDPVPTEINSVKHSEPQSVEPVVNSHVPEDFVNLLDTPEPPSQFDLVNQLSPPPVAVPVQRLPDSPQVADDPDLPLEIDALPSKEPKHLHMSAMLMDEFMRMAKSNTTKNIETCGVLAGSFEGGEFFVTALIIPKQKATANTCETIEEEEIFFAQDKRGLFQLGWIHTHPTQSCFMSSVDVHTHYSYQVMLPEAIAIVMAPQDPSRGFGIFRLSDPGGMNVIQQCSKRGFHGHDQTSDGSPLYDKTNHVYLDTKAKFEVIDLR